MVKYIKCPRCDLNYIDSEKQEYCDVCIAEMKGNKLQFADLEDEDYDEIDAEIEGMEMCPLCGVVRMRPGETMCDVCKNNPAFDEEEEDVDIEKDEEWKNYLDEEEDGDLTIDDETLQEEIDAETAAEEEELENGEDDDFFEEEDVDSLSELEDDEYDDDDDDFDDDDDDDLF